MLLNERINKSQLKAKRDYKRYLVPLSEAASNEYITDEKQHHWDAAVRTVLVSIVVAAQS